MAVARGSAHRRAAAELLANATHCYWCGREISTALPVGHPSKATADHLHAVAEGGADVLDNYVPACSECNSRRGARDPATLLNDVPGAEDW